MGKTYGRMFETLPRYEPLETKPRPIFQFKIKLFEAGSVLSKAVLFLNPEPTFGKGLTA